MRPFCGDRLRGACRDERRGQSTLILHRITSVIRLITNVTDRGSNNTSGEKNVPIDIKSIVEIGSRTVHIVAAILRLMHADYVTVILARKDTQ